MRSFTSGQIELTQSLFGATKEQLLPAANAARRAGALVYDRSRTKSSMIDAILRRIGDEDLIEVRYQGYGHPQKWKETVDALVNAGLAHIYDFPAYPKTKVTL